MAILVTCTCGRQLQAGDEYAGRRARCPNCGRELIMPPAGSSPFAPPKADFSPAPDFAGPGYLEPTTSGKAITSLILGLTSLVCLLVTGVPALIVGFLGLSEIDRSGGRLRGRGMAITGIILGGFGTIMLPVILAALLLPAVQAAREAARRSQCVNNFKQIGIAMHNFHNEQGHLPPAAITDPDGNPLLSWRVAILPYVEQQSLYEQFKLDEPWNSPHNQALLGKMPDVFRCPTDPDVDRTATRYQVLTGPGTLFESAEGTRLDEVTDGLSNTLMVVESQNPVPWTKPEELTYEPDGPPPALGSNHPNGFNALLGDGAVRFLKTTLDSQTLRGLITRNGGEVFSLDE